MAKTRTIARQFEPVAATQYRNLLVSGCSYTWNNSETDICTWPYYLRDLAGFDQVLDCSQAGSGFGHTFNSVIHEIETNTAVSADDTFVIIMWSGPERVDITCDSAVVRTWSNMETQQLGTALTSLSLFNSAPSWLTRIGSDIESLRKQYHTVIDSSAQLFDSHIQITALEHYLQNLGFRSVFLNWDSDRNTAPVTLGRTRVDFAPVPTLGHYATVNQLRIPGDGHPSPDAHLAWTRSVLLPYLTENNLI